MKNLFKRSLAVALALVMCISMMNLTAFAASYPQEIGYCNQCNSKRYRAKCGGEYCVNSLGWAVHITKGSACVDDQNGDPNLAQPHDHQCDFCHAEHLDLVETTTTATCYVGGETIVKCGYKDCTYVQSRTTTGPLSADWGTCVETKNADGTIITHTQKCTRCGNNASPAEGHVRSCTFTPTVTSATCDVAGSTSYTCEFCGTHTTTGTTLSPDFTGATWMKDNAQGDHYRYCQRDECSHNEPGHTERGAHVKDTTRVTTTRIAGTNGNSYTDENGNSFTFNSATHFLNYHTAPCTANCGYLYEWYSVTERNAAQVNVVYVDGNGTNCGTATNVASVRDGYSTTIAAATHSNVISEGYELVANQADQTVAYSNAVDGVITVTFNVQAKTHKVIVEVEVDGEPEGTPSETEKKFGETIDPVNPQPRPGYEVEVDTSEVPADGKMPDEDVTITIKYTAIHYTVVINYLNSAENAEGGHDVLSPAVTIDNLTVKDGDGDYTQDSPTIDGYRLADAGQATVSGVVTADTIPAEGTQIVIDVYYTALGNRTVRWVNWNGTSVLQAGSFREDQTAPASSAYSNATPTRASDGTYTYTFSGWDAGVEDEDGNVTYTAQYTRTLIYYPPVVTPTPSPEPSEEVEVTEPPTPLDPTPELPDEPIEVDEPDTPLVDLPELPEEPVEVEIEDPDTPLANVPQTGDNTVLWATTAVASGAGLIWLAVDGKKRREDAE